MLLQCYPLSPSALLHLQGDYSSRMILAGKTVANTAHKASAIHRAPSIQNPTQQSRREEDVEQEAEPETIRGPAGREQIANRQKPQNKCDNRAEKYAQVFKQIFKSWFAQKYHSADRL